MKVIIVLFCCLVTSLITSSCYAASSVKAVLHPDELNLKDFGFSYCLTKSKDSLLSSEASLAMGGYFQRGTYEEPAYGNLKKYVDHYIKGANDVYQSTDKPAILMNCLHMYNSVEYKNLITQQKKYLIK